MTISYYNEVAADIAPAPIGHNAPLSPIDELRERLALDHATSIARAQALHDGVSRVPDAITNDELAGRATDFIAQISAATKVLDQARVAAKEPHLTAGRLVDGFFGGPIRQLDADKSVLNGRLGRYLKAKQEHEAQRRAEAEREARIEAERRADEAVALEAAGRVEAAQAALAEAQAAEEVAAEVAAAPVVVSARGDYGAVGSLRQPWTFEVEDRTKIALETLRPYLPTDAVDKAIRAFIRAGGRSLTGVRIYQDARAGVR